MSCHLRRSKAKLELVVSPNRVVARSDSMTNPAHGGPLHPFWGAEHRTSTPSSSISTQIVPDAMQSSTNNPPTAWVASASAAM